MSWLRAIYSFFYELLFGCSHGHLTRPFTIATHSYKVCLDCGKQFPYSLEKMRTIHSWEAARQTAHAVPTATVSAMPAPAAFAPSEAYEPREAVA